MSCSSDNDLIDSFITGEDLIFSPVLHYPTLLAFIGLCLQNTYLAKAKHNPYKYQHRITVYNTSMCFLSGWLDRLANMHEKPIAII